MKQHFNMFPFFFFLKLTLCTEHEKEQRWNIKLLGKPQLLQHMWKITNVMLAHMVTLHVMKPVLQSVAHVRAQHDTTSLHHAVEQLCPLL